MANMWTATNIKCGYCGVELSDSSFICGDCDD